MDDIIDIVQRVLHGTGAKGGVARFPNGCFSSNQSFEEDKPTVEYITITEVRKSRFEQLEKELESSREETNRYKSELESSSESFKVVIALKNNKKELESSREEMKECTREIDAKKLETMRLEVALESSKLELAECKKEVKTKSDEIKTKDIKIARLQTTQEANKKELKLCKEEMKKASDAINNKDDKIVEMVKTLGNAHTMTLTGGPLDQETIRATFTGISKLNSTDLFSQSLRVAGADWAFSIKTSMKGPKKYLSTSLMIVSPFCPSAPSYTVYYKETLFSHNGSKPWVAKCYDRKARGWNQPTFISFDDLFKSSNEFVKNDDLHRFYSFLVKIEIYD